MPIDKSIPDEYLKLAEEWHTKWCEEGDDWDGQDMIESLARTVKEFVDSKLSNPS